MAFKQGFYTRRLKFKTSDTPLGKVPKILILYAPILLTSEVYTVNILFIWSKLMKEESRSELSIKVAT